MKVSLTRKQHCFILALLTLYELKSDTFSFGTTMFRDIDMYIFTCIYLGHFKKFTKKKNTTPYHTSYDVEWNMHRCSVFLLIVCKYDFCSKSFSTSP